jgi:secondary thiamine-phosphate synthase enzyme
MTHALSRIRLQTAEPIELIDISARLRDICAECDVSNGVVTPISNHTTAYVAINERETGLQRDMVDFLRRVAPAGRDYRHDRAPVDGRKNAHAHLAGLFMNASESIPLVEGELLLGNWQSVFFVELDGPRPDRSVLVHILGES